jgi:phytoene dehydrogenase-like protein
LQDYDGIVIGAGPNGLTVGAYLAKAGLKVLVLEKRFELGGGLSTERVTIPGFLHDVHAIYHMMVDYAPPLKDLRLEEDFDLKWIYPELQVVMPFSDGKYLALYSDPERSYESIKQFSAKDAEAFKNFARWSQQAMDLFLAPASYVNPAPSLDQSARLEANPITKSDDELTGFTPKQIVDGWFENERVRALFLYLSCMWGLDYDLEGLGYLVPLMMNRGWHFRLSQGGSHHLAHLMSKFIYQSGGMVLTNQMVKRLIIENGQAKGVELEDGRVIKANKFVCSSLDPHQTFLELVGEDHLDPELTTRVREWTYSDWSFFTVHMALYKAPQFKIAESDPSLNNALIYVLGYENEEELVNHFKAIKRGELISGGFNSCFPSIHDPIRAPSGRHVGLISQEAPYNLKDGGAQAWYQVRREHAERCKEVLSRYAPNMTDENVIWDYMATPLDTENKFADMKQGCFKQGAYLPLQMGYFRPNEYCCQHSTPIEKLYMCGACTHSGGMITFGPGYCATEKIAEDLGIEKWWPENQYVKKAKEAGLF